MPLWRRERQQRREDRERTRCWRRTTPRLRMIALVEVTAIPMPTWAKAKAVPGLSVSPSSVWLGRIAANLLARIDREAGGEPRITPTVYRRCAICKRPLLGEQAEARFDLDRKFEGKRLPCGPDCVEVQAVRKRRRPA